MLSKAHHCKAAVGDIHGGRLYLSVRLPLVGVIVFEFTGPDAWVGVVSTAGKIVRNGGQ